MTARSRVSDMVYRAMLRLYPVRFQEDFASDMALDFADASDDAWLAARWAGLVRLWIRSAADLVRSIAVQWVRTRVPAISAFSLCVALSTVAIAQTITPRGQFLANIRPNDRDLIILMVLAACVLLIIASTIIFTHWFLRPLLYRGSSRRR
jgi:hypothetical protein